MIAASRILAVALVVLASGCMNIGTAERHMQEFLAATPAAGADEISQISITPIWLEWFHAQDIQSRPDGKIHIAEARLTVVSWLLFARVKVVDFKRPAPQRERPVYPRDPLTARP